MIDPNQLDMQRLLNFLLELDYQPDRNWRRLAVIEEKDGKWFVKIGKWYLRQSHGPRQGHFWDVYGDDYQEPEWAIVALSKAFPPPHFMNYGAMKTKEEDR